MNRVKLLLKLANAFRRARALDYEKDPNPEHWKTINGAKVHLDKNGKYDGGAGGKFNGNYHFGGSDWKDKKAQIQNLTNIFNQAVAQKQAQANAQGNGQGNTSAQNVASKATQGGGGSGIIIKTEQEYEAEILDANREYMKKLRNPNATSAEKQAAFDKVKAISIEAAEQGHAIIHERLRLSTATPEQIDAIKTHLRNAPTEIRALWNIYSLPVEQDLDMTATTETVAHYDSARMVHMDFEEVSKGSTISQPYETFFHENGHAIDAELSLIPPLKATLDAPCEYAARYNNGEFIKAIESDVKNIVSFFEKQVKEKVNEGDYRWLDTHGLIDATDRFYYGRKNPQTGRYELQQMPPGFKYKKAMAYRRLEDQLEAMANNGLRRDIANMCDIINGATYGKVTAVAKHPKRYWKDSKVNGENYGVAVEAFAEFIASSVVNPKSMEVLKKYLPTASDCFDRMIKDAVK